MDRRERINWAWMAGAVVCLAITVYAIQLRFISCAQDPWGLCEPIHNPESSGPPFVFFILNAAIATAACVGRAFYRKEPKDKKRKDKRPMRESPPDYTLN